MKGKFLSLAIVFLMVVGSFGAVENLKAEGTNGSTDYVVGEVVVGFYENMDVESIDSFDGYAIKEKIIVLNVAVVCVNEGEEQSFINSALGFPYVKYAELNKVVHLFYTPNDPLWGQQWGPERIHCEEAWDNETGSSSVKIAIVDTGIDYNHEDISGNYVSGGYDWVNDDNDPMDDNNHGTHCAGIAAAVMDNNKGIAGVAQVSVMAEKVLSSGGSGSASDVASGITHASDNGANIISMSLGSNSPSSVIEDACDYAYNTKGVVLVAASGNDGQSQVSYPAGYDTVIAVGAIDSEDERCDFSNYGEDLELVAPGYRVVSSIPGNEYEFYSGTSMACPHVSGVAALAKSLYPSQNNIWIRQKLVDTAEDLGPAGWDEEYGYGLVDARLGGGGPSNWPKVTIQLHKLQNIDPIDWITGGEAEWYYRVSVEDKSVFEYNGQDVEILPGWWIFDWNSQDIWTPDKNYVFDATSVEVQVKIKLMEHDGLLEGGSDDLADVSAYQGGGADNSITDLRGAIYQGTYNIATNTLTGDTTGQDSGYLTTNGEADGSTSTDENDAKVWFKISDDYEPPEGDLDAQGDLSWSGVTPSSTVTSDIYVENVGEPDPFGQNMLSWAVTDWPEWGTWSFSPSSGTGLEPGEGPVDVHVTVVVPDLDYVTYLGVVRIVNTENPSDYVDITVELVTPRTVMHPILNKILQRFPILWQLFSLLERNSKLYKSF